MYNQSYDEYIRSILGYPMDYNNIYSKNGYDMSMQYREDYLNMETNGNEQLEQYYPEIYKIVYPMVKKACNENRRDIFTKEDVDKMVDEVYNAIEPNVENVNLNINLTNAVQSANTKTTVDTKMENRSSNTTKENTEINTRSESRNLRNNNFMLNDLIRILILRELIRRRRPNRPPFPGRPPYSGGNQRPPMRPPFPGGGARPQMNRSELYDMIPQCNFEGDF